MTGGLCPGIWNTLTHGKRSFSFRYCFTSEMVKATGLGAPSAALDFFARLSSENLVRRHRAPRVLSGRGKSIGGTCRADLLSSNIQ